MPCFDFKNSKTGQTQEFIVNSGVVVFEDKDGSYWSKVQEPPRIAIGGYTEPSQAQEIKRGYYKLEQTGWKGKYTKNQVKKAWGI